MKKDNICTMRMFLLKLKFLFAVTFLLFIIIWTIYISCETLKIQSLWRREHGQRKPTLKYILQWTLPDTIPFVYMGEGQETFIKRNCTFTNCYVTSSKSFLYDIKEFDVIAFHGPEIILKNLKLPKRRSSKQKYVFVSIESSDYYPICDNRFNGYFNWTWTYKLKSDEPFGYITIRNKKGEIIGPKQDMHWIKIEEMEPISENVLIKLQNKSKAGAWFVSNCNSLSRREKFVQEVKKALIKYNLSVDIYGNCGPLKCPSETMADCLEMIERDYYFYFSLENSFSEDYVTEKLLHALQHYAVPIVFGDANYTRFMPDGIYLNGRELGAVELAKQMNDIIKDKTKYYNFFKWHNYYSYHSREEAPNSDDYCKFCSMINDEQLMNKTSVYDNFKEWWTPPNRKC